MSDIAMKATGFDLFDAKLARLDNKVARDIVKAATRSAAKVSLKQVKSNAKSMVGGKMGALLAKHSVIRVFKHQRRGSYGVQIGMKPNVPEFDYWPVGASSALTTKKATGKKSYIPAALEYGHDNARPIPYIRAAWAVTKKQAVRRMGIELKQGIEREAKT